MYCRTLSIHMTLSLSLCTQGRWMCREKYMYNIYIYYVLSVDLHMEAKSLVVCAPGDCVRKEKPKNARITTQYIDLSFSSVSISFFRSFREGKRERERKEKGTSLSFGSHSPTSFLETKAY